MLRANALDPLAELGCIRPQIALTLLIPDIDSRVLPVRPAADRAPHGAPANIQESIVLKTVEQVAAGILDRKRQATA